MSDIICSSCNTVLSDNEISLAYNLGFGVFYYCCYCEPTKSPEEIIETIDLAITPLKEN